jgi:hypothetical protein
VQILESHGSVANKKDRLLIAWREST